MKFLLILLRIIIFIINIDYFIYFINVFYKVIANKYFY